MIEVILDNSLFGNLCLMQMARSHTTLRICVPEVTVAVLRARECSMFNVQIRWSCR